MKRILVFYNRKAWRSSDIIIAIGPRRRSINECAEFLKITAEEIIALYERLEAIK